MIHRIRLKNFKKFENQSLDIGALTLLTGINGMGKSSVLQSLLLLRQSYQQRILDLLSSSVYGEINPASLALNGDLVHIGTAKDALFEDAKQEVIEFAITFTDNVEAAWEFNGYVSENTFIKGCSKIAAEVYQQIYQHSLFKDDFQYLQAERIGPRTSSIMSDSQVRNHEQLGNMGEYTAHFLSIFRDRKIPHSALSHPKAKSLNLLSQVEAWLGEISPGTRISIIDRPGMDVVSLQYSFGNSGKYRATNVGFGITYTLPVITAILSANPGALLLIENPEAHLHPKGQAKMGHLIAQAAAQGVQIILETHSDHVLNGIRLAVHGGNLDPDAVRLHFFQSNGVVSPRMNRKGRISEWPEGFFDEWDNSLAALLQPISSGAIEE
jgi:predicted ATPase